MGLKVQDSKALDSERQELKTLFEKLLEAPLSSSDSSFYALYHTVDSELFGDPQASKNHFETAQDFYLKADTKEEPGDPTQALEWRTCQLALDLSETIVVYESADEAPSRIVPMSACNEDEELLVVGHQLCALDELASVLDDAAGYIYRVRTEGSLFAAMKTLLLLGDPNSPLTANIPTDSWIRQIGVSTALQQHLAALCADRDSYMEVPSSDESFAGLSSFPAPCFHYCTGEGGWSWFVVPLPTPNLTLSNRAD